MRHHQGHEGAGAQISCVKRNKLSSEEAMFDKKWSNQTCETTELQSVCNDRVYEGSELFEEDMVEIWGLIYKTLRRICVRSGVRMKHRTCVRTEIFGFIKPCARTSYAFFP